ncbi:MAG: FAD:protein FMN transferase [Bacillota bacterium]|nr:FAD:protein FMN transferase [Bacillota bacterium]
MPPIKIKPSIAIPLFSLIVVALFFYIRVVNAEKMNVYYRVTMDTSVELRFSSNSSVDPDVIKEAVFDEIKRMENIFSRSIEESEISRINRMAGVSPVAVSPEMLAVLEMALQFTELTGGAFNPAIAPVIDAWGFFSQVYKIPSGSDLKNTLEVSDYRNVEIDYEQSTVFLSEKGMALELGGIAKGFIIDQAMAVLNNYGVEHAFINAGGDILLKGTKTDGSLWKIGVRNPREEEKIIAVFHVSEGAVVTSGDYERFFEEGGKRYHHILDPLTGYPAGELASVTVLAPSAVIADTLSTAIFILGPVQGINLVESLPEVEALLITPGLEIIQSGGLHDNVEVQF